MRQLPTRFPVTPGAHQKMRLDETMAPMPIADAARLAWHQAQVRR
jgi:hypothetical protein